MELDNVEVFEVKDVYDKRYNWPGEAFRKCCELLSAELRSAALLTLKCACESVGIDWDFVQGMRFCSKSLFFLKLTH